MATAAFRTSDTVKVAASVVSVALTERAKEEKYFERVTSKSDAFQRIVLGSGLLGIASLAQVGAVSDPRALSCLVIEVAVAAN